MLRKATKAKIEMLRYQISDLISIENLSWKRRLGKTESPGNLGKRKTKEIPNEKRKHSCCILYQHGISALVFDISVSYSLSHAYRKNIRIHILKRDLHPFFCNILTVLAHDLHTLRV